MLIAQNKNIEISASTTGFYSTGEDLPFWFTANQQGIFEQENNIYEFGELKISKEFDNEKKWSFTYGGRYIYANGTSNYQQFNEWYAGVKNRLFYIKAGAFPEPTLYGKLSSTNGTMAWSNNARPFPRIKAGTNEFIPLPFGQDNKFWRTLKFKGVYQEGILDDDNRYVLNTHLHHKLIYFQKEFNQGQKFTIGADHYIMWGGESPDLGKLPGFKSYLRYIFALSGNEEFGWWDQEYKAGNQFGRYYMAFEKAFYDGKVTYYLDHPFEDRISLGNMIDNLFGVYYKSNEKRMLSEILFEIMYTNDQNIVIGPDLEIKRNFWEYYFRHPGTYHSGFSYNNKMIASAFFAPIVIEDGINLGTANNRVSMFHLGASGFINSNLKWKYLISGSRNYGTYGSFYNIIDPTFFDGSHFFQLSMLNEFTWFITNNWQCNLAIGTDLGQKLEKQIGVQIKIQKSFEVF